MALAALLALALLWNAAAAAEAVRRGVTLCLTSVIPALFPFFAVSSLLVSLGAGDAARVLERPFRALFRCGGAGAAAFLLGMIGGYMVTEENAYVWLDADGNEVVSVKVL